MGSLVKSNRQIERKKRFWAAGTAGAGALLTLTSSSLLGLPLLGYGIYLGYDWFMYRARHGMRF